MTALNPGHRAIQRNKNFVTFLNNECQRFNINWRGQEQEPLQNTKGRGEAWDGKSQKKILKNYNIAIKIKQGGRNH